MAVSAVEAAMIHEPNLLSVRSWWQPTLSRAEAEAFLLDAHTRLSECELHMGEPDNWARSPQLDRYPLAVVRHSSTESCLALSWVGRKRSKPRVTHALVMLVFGDDSATLAGYCADLGEFECVEVRTLAALVAHVLPATPVSVDVSRLLDCRPDGPRRLLHATVHRWSSVGDLMRSLSLALEALLPPDAIWARHLSLMQFVRDRRVLRAVLDALAIDRRGLNALAVAFVRHGIGAELLDVALSDRVKDGAWLSGGAVRPGGALFATLGACLAQAACGAWLRPQLASALEALKSQADTSDGDVLKMVGVAVISITQSTAPCPPLLQSAVRLLSALRPQQHSDAVAFVCALCIAPFLRSLASSAMSTSSQSGARSLMSAAALVSQLGEDGGGSACAPSTWRLWAPPIEAALRAFCQQLCSDEQRSEQSAVADVLFDDCQAASVLPNSGTPLDVVSIESMQRALAPCAQLVVSAVRSQCATLEGQPDASLCEALAPLPLFDMPRVPRVEWTLIEALLREPLAVVDRCALRVARGAHLYASADALLASLVRPTEQRSFAAYLHSLSSDCASDRRGADKVLLMRNTRSFPSRTTELSSMQFEAVLDTERVAFAPTRNLLKRIVTNNDAERDVSAALLAGIEDASDADVVQFRQRTSALALSLPAGDFRGVAMPWRRGHVRAPRFERDFELTLWSGDATATVRVTPGMTALEALRTVADQQPFADLPDTWALKLAFAESFIVGAARQSVPLCDFVAVQDMVLDGRGVRLVLLRDVDARFVDGSEQAREHFAAFAQLVRQPVAVSRAAATSVRVVGERQKFECQVNEVVFFDSDADLANNKKGLVGTMLCVELTMTFGATPLTAPRRTLPIDVSAGVAPELAGLPALLGLLVVDEWIVGALHLGHLPHGTLLRWRLLAGTVPVAESVAPLYDSSGWLSQGRQTIELRVLDEAPPALRCTRPFLVVTLMSFLGDPNLPRIRVFHPHADTSDATDGEVQRVSDAAAAAATPPLPSADECRALASIDGADCFRRATNEEKALFRRFRSQLPSLAPHSLARIVDGSSVFDWLDVDDVDELHALVSSWADLDVRSAIDVLVSPCADQCVRRRAIRALSAVDDASLTRLLPQLVEALRVEVHDESDLQRFLMSRAALAPLVVGVALVHKLRVDICFSHTRPPPVHLPAVSVARLRLRFALYVERVLAVCRPLAGVVDAQMLAIESLESLNRSVKPLAYGAKRSEALTRLLTESLVVGWPKSWRLPFDSSIVCGRPSVSRSRAMDSHQCPLLVCFPLLESAPVVGLRAGDDDFASIIFKIGDDVRQDECVMQLLHVLQDAWDGADVGVSLVLYRAVAVGFNSGMIECVKHCSTVAKIQASRGGSMLGALRSTPLRTFLAETTPLDSAGWRDVVDTFSRTLAAACVATLALGIGDRHNDNVMLKKNGALFHIDFGHVLGNFKTLEKACCSLTKEMAFVLGGEDSRDFESFVALAVRAFNVARSAAPLLVSLLAGVVGAGLRELRDEADILFLRTSLGPGDDVDAEQRDLWFRKVLLSSLGTFSTSRLLNFGHLVAHQKAMKESH
jgi:hypothetical protein